MAVTVRNDLHLGGTTTSAMIALQRLQETLVEETLLLLRSTALFEVVLSDIEG